MRRTYRIIAECRGDSYGYTYIERLFRGKYSTVAIWYGFSALDALDKIREWDKRDKHTSNISLIVTGYMSSVKTRQTIGHM